MGGRYRSISRSYSPPSPRRESRSPPRRKKRYDDPRDRYPGPSAVTGGRGFRDRRFDGRSGLLVRNISLDARFGCFVFTLIPFCFLSTNAIFFISKFFFFCRSMAIDYTGQKISGFLLNDLDQLRMSTFLRIITQGKIWFLLFLLPTFGSTSLIYKY